MNSRKPLSRERLTEIFVSTDNKNNYIRAREGKTLEYKESYSHGNMAHYFKTMASFANTEGGYIIFGIGDKPRNFLGLKDKNIRQFEDIRIEQFTNNLNEYFQPEIKWEHVLFEYNNKTYGVIYTYMLDRKPCICTKNYDDKDRKYSLKEGDIYFRYRARTQKIKYAELRNIFNENVEAETKKWMQLIEHTAKVGIDNASILNLDSGELGIGNSTLVINEELLAKIKFIKKGMFIETGGSPTLRLVGDINNIKTTDLVITKPKLRAIEQSDIIQFFLEEKNIEQPFEYIKVMLNCSSGFQPIYYYIKNANIEVSEVIEYIMEEKKDSQTVKLILQRLNGRREKKISSKSLKTEAAKNKNRYFEMWKCKKIESVYKEVNDPKKWNWILQSFMMLDDKLLLEEKNYYKNVLLCLYNSEFKNKTGNLMSSYRRALCRLDEVLFLGEMLYNI